MAQDPWDVSSQELDRARSTIQRRFQHFHIGAVALAGLVDGINPCAFTTLIFFIAYLGFVGTGRREILAVGATFAMAVFTVVFLGINSAQISRFFQKEVGILKLFLAILFL